MAAHFSKRPVGRSSPRFTFQIRIKSKTERKKKKTVFLERCKKIIEVMVLNDKATK